MSSHSYSVQRVGARMSRLHYYNKRADGKWQTIVFKKIMTLYEANRHYDDDDDGNVSQTFMKIKYVVSYDKIALVFISNLLSKLALAVTIVTCIGCFFPPT